MAELRAKTKEECCTFISTIEMIKQFAIVNKIFTVNKVVIPLPKRERGGITGQKSTTPHNSQHMVSPMGQKQTVSPFKTTMKHSNLVNNKSMTNIMTNAAHATMPRGPNGCLPQFGGVMPQHPRHTIQFAQPQQPLAPINPLKQVSQFITPASRLQQPPTRLEKKQFSNPF